MTDLKALFEQPGMRILDALGEAVFGFDADGHCVHAGPPALTLLQVDSLDKVLGRTLAELLRRPLPVSLPPWDQCLAYMADNAGKGMRSDLENLVRPDGNEVPVSIALLSVPTPDASLALAVVVRDVSERSRQSKAFHASVKSFRALLDGVSDAILFVSRQGRVVDANQGMSAMFGYPPAVIQGKSVDNLLDPASHDRGFISDACPAVLDGHSRHIEFSARNRRGVVFPAEVYLYPSSYFNQPVAMAIVHDISERRRQEAALMAARDLAEQSSRLKGEIIRNMSHEFRTPLAAMIGMGDLLADTDLDEEQQVYLQEARNGARQMLDMVNGILELAKLESGQYRSEAVDFQPAALLGELAQRFASTAGAKGLALRVDAGPGLPDSVSGDQDGLAKALVPLLDNAIKFTARGEVVLGAVLEESGEIPAGACRIHFSVRDTGIGIAPEAQSRIFDSFVQADGSATRHHGGIGLGLGIASRLVAAMGGHLEVASSPGQGSSFHFVLLLGPPEYA